MSKERKMENYNNITKRYFNNVNINKFDFATLNKTNEKFIKCCFCNKEITMSESKDIFPIKSNKGNYCCKQCEINIVIPTQIKLRRQGIEI